jgi:hypothetical protein
VRTGTGQGADVGRERLTLQEAAHRLGVSESAIRKRVKRRSLAHEKTEEGRVLVYLDTVSAPSAPAASDSPHPNTDALISAKDDLVDSLREQLAAERRANEENRRIIAGLIERLLPPQIELPESQREAESAPESSATPRCPGSSSAWDGAEKRSVGASERDEFLRAAW